jgi:hypothetical protein
VAVYKQIMLGYSSAFSAIHLYAKATEFFLPLHSITNRFLKRPITQFLETMPGTWHSFHHNLEHKIFQTEYSGNNMMKTTDFCQRTL